MNKWWKMICRIGSYVGLKIHYADPNGFGVQYNGDGHAVADCTRLAAHEVGHYLIATPASRKLLNFGLGPDPDYGSMLSETVLKVSGRKTAYMVSLEESLSDVLGVLIQRAIGDDWMDTCKRHGWNRCITEEWPYENLYGVMAHELKELEKRKLVVDGIPVCVRDVIHPDVIRGREMVE